MKGIVFKEEQKFTQLWLWLLLGGLFLWSVYGAYSNNKLPNMWFGVIVIAVVGLFFLVTKLTTQIDSKGIHIYFFPLVRRSYIWEELESVEIINYGFIGGWGIRLWTPYGTAYNIKGNKGIALTLKNGKKVLIGTQKAEELKDMLHQFTQKK